MTACTGRNEYLEKFRGVWPDADEIRDCIAVYRRR